MSLIQRPENKEEKGSCTVPSAWSCPPPPTLLSHCPWVYWLKIEARTASGLQSQSHTSLVLRASAAGDAPGCGSILSLAGAEEGASLGPVSSRILPKHVIRLGTSSGHWAQPSPQVPPMGCRSFCSSMTSTSSARMLKRNQETGSQTS